MQKTFAVVGKTLTDYRDEMFGLMLCNLCWLVAQVLIIPGPPATAALFYVTNRVAHGHFARLSEFWQAFKRFFLVSCKWGALNLLVILVFGNAFLFYGSGKLLGSFGFVLALMNLVLLAMWFFTQLFAFPFWLEQSDKRIGQALRNALVLQANNVGLVMIVLVLVVVMLALTVIFPVLLGMITAAFLTLLGNEVVVARVETWRNEQELADEMNRD